MKKYLAVSAPVTDLRRTPADSTGGPPHDELQETQLLFNESLFLLDEIKEWYYVGAEEQPKFSEEQGWHAYSGWVRKRDVSEVKERASANAAVCSAFSLLRSVPSHDKGMSFPVSFGTRLSITGEENGFYRTAPGSRGVLWVSRKDVMIKGGAKLAFGELARRLLGAPYLWGGRSFPLDWPGVVAMGVDCSALTNLVFRVKGTDIPRNAHDQWLTATPIKTPELREGNLIFISRQGEPSSVVHVMLSLSGESFIEAPETGDMVQTGTFLEKFGVDLRQLFRLDFMVDERQIFLGRIDVQE